MIKQVLFFVGIWVGTASMTYAQHHATTPGVKRKIASSLLEKSETNVRVSVSRKEEFIQWLTLHMPSVKAEEKITGILELKNVTASELQRLEKNEFVVFIDRTNRKAFEERSLGAFDLTLNNIFAVHKVFSTITGTGTVASIKEKPFDTEDIDLKNRIILTNQFDEPFTDHASLMASIIAGGGNSEASATGVARNAKVTTSDFDQLLPDDGNLLTSLGVTVQNHSYGIGGIENYYGIETSEYDKHCQNFPSIVHVFSSGNVGDQTSTSGAYANIPGYANLTGQFKVSKNTITVGSADVTGQVTAKSSRGPAYDGRVKPELIAYGDAGSSDAAAVVSGIASLIQQQYFDIHAEWPSSELVKAILINSADDIGRAHVDFESGFGVADALGALKTVSQQNFFTGQITQGENLMHTISVPAGIHQLKITLVWNDKEAEPNATYALVNDLDVMVTHTGTGVTWKPWVLNSFPKVDSLIKPAQRSEDHLNTIEQITVELPPSGEYVIQLSGYSISEGQQSYSLAFEYEQGFEWTNPVEESAFPANRNNIIRWRWSGVPSSGKIEYRFVDTNEWIEIANPVSLTNQYQFWITPDTTAQVQLRLTANSTVYESGYFTVTKPIGLKVGYNCTDETLLQWNRVPSAQQYKVYTVGETSLESFLITTDTIAILNSLQKESKFYAVAPILNGMEAMSGNTINYETSATQCYFISFVPQQYIVDDIALFDLTIGTTYKLKSVQLERFDNGIYTPVNVLSPITNTVLTLTDPNPKPGKNYYRVKLIDTHDFIVYTSSDEEILYVREQDLLVFPNPVRYPETLNIVVDDLDAVRVRLYDVYGRPLREITDPGLIKTIDTNELVSGSYILEVMKSNGTRLTTRIIVLK